MPHESWIPRDRQLYRFDLPCGVALATLTEQDRTAVARHAAGQKEIDRLAGSSKRLAI
jgi:hypothetical protein